MIEFRRILCPTDFSDFSRRALEHAVALAGWYRSKIEVIHIHPSLVGIRRSFPYFPEALSLDPQVRQLAQDEMQRFVQPARSAGVPVEIDVLAGEAADVIIRRALDAPPDLLVIGTHGRSGFDRLVLGSVTEKVMRKVLCPVLTVPATVKTEVETVRFRRVLCPIDFSPSSVKSMEYALSLALESGGGLLLLHVVERADTLEKQSFLEQIKHEAAERLSQAVPEQARTWCHPEEIVVQGRAYQEILRLSAERSSELIVMGIQGRNVLDLMVFGSTTNKVIREAKCPVLTIRG